MQSLARPTHSPTHLVTVLDFAVLESASSSESSESSTPLSNILVNVVSIPTTPMKSIFMVSFRTTKCWALSSPTRLKNPET